MIARSPLAPDGFPDMPPIAGLRLGCGEAGIKYKDRADILLVAFDQPAAVAGVLTKSATASAAIEWCRKALEGGRASGLLVNAGNANAFTGSVGVESVGLSISAVCRALDTQESEVFVASTGVIGEPLPDQKVIDAVEHLANRLTTPDWHAAAQAIMTTDTFAKGAYRSAKIEGVEVKICGIAKGSGMIAPDMATMLAFVFTDAALPPEVLRPLLQRGSERSFNATTVDGDTSTSDTLLLFATGAAGNAKIDDWKDRRLRAFREALDAVLIDLAQQVVRDGEGASKFITVEVSEAASARAAKRIALSIANSPLVKTAIAGEDANWGRIVMAVGKAGEKADRDRLSISIGGVEVARNGQRVPGYDEAPVARHMKGQEIDIAVAVGVGRGQARVWTCDLTHGYISINADYRS